MSDDTAGLPLFATTPRRRRSKTSIDAAASIKCDTIAKRREHVYLAIVSSGTAGLARFQIADRLGVEQHWISSSVDALLHADPPRIVELDRTVLNPRSGKRCAVLVATR